MRESKGFGRVWVRALSLGLGVMLLAQAALGVGPSAAQTRAGEPTANGAATVDVPAVFNGVSRETIASGVVRSGEAGSVEHPNGARIDVPVGAVPTNVQGGEGEMLFTIETGTPSTYGLPATPPQGWVYASEVCKMGPEGFIFAAPIQATIPVPTGFSPSEYEFRMFDYLPATAQWVEVGGQISADGSEVTADVLHLCNNVLLAMRWSGKGAGAIRFSTILGYSFRLCIESYTLRYPEVDGSFQAGGRFCSLNRRDASTTPPDGFQYWVLPQGTYTVSVMVYRHDDDPLRTPHYLGYYTHTFEISRCHWDINSAAPRNFEFVSYFPDLAPWTNPALLNPGRPDCMALPSNSAGVGQLNVRLDWAALADLDLWVVDPCGNKIYWDARTQGCQESTGTLDLDNWCQNIVVGRPENIFWAANPPRGTYKVYVDYYLDCSNAGTVPFTVRWWMRGQAFGARGTLSPPAHVGNAGDEVLVATFVY
jgi:hypothetical protein